jgi:hypothetical protein
VLTTAREFRFGLIEARVLLLLAHLASEQGDDIQAATYLHDAEVKYRELGHGEYLAEGLNEIGYRALRQGNHERARGLMAEAVALAGEFGSPSAIAGFTRSLGDVLRAGGEFAGAAVQYRDALNLAQEVGDRMMITTCLAGLAGLAAETGRNQEASRLFGMVELLRETVGLPSSRYEEEQQAQDMTAVRDALGTKVDAEARAAGRELALETAVSNALALADELVASAST